MRTPVLFSMLGLSLFACRSDSNNGVDAPNGTVDAPVGGVVHIQDVQSPMMTPGTAVALKGVIVTAIDSFGTKTGDIWVEEPGGGEFSGVHVFGAPVAMVSGLAQGDIVDIGGALKDEFALTSDTTGRTVTELKAGPSGMTVTKTGTGTVPAPMVVDALAIGQMATQALRDVEWEKWEGVLITVNNVAATGDIKQIGGTTPDPTLQSFAITGIAKAESSLAAFPTGIASGVCLASMTGVVDYFFDYLVLPRTTAEVSTGGTTCAVENTVSMCGDGIDNDGNGFADCADNACIVAAPTCRMTTSITAVQATLPTTAVEIDNVFVTGVAHNKRSFWVSTSLTAAPNQGLYVFGSKTLDAGVVVGAKVSIIGKISEFNDDMTGGTLTELAPLQVTVVAAPAGAPVPVTNQTAAQLLVAATAPTFESVLVTLTNVKITALGTTTNGLIATAVQNGTTFGAGTDIIQSTDPTPLTAGTCYSSITGFWTNLEAGSTSATTKPNAFGFIPATLGAVGTACI